MPEGKKRKTDRRTLYTRQAIKDAFLSLKKNMDLNSITVSAICKKAELSRGTFYLHYQNTRDILDDILEDILPQASELTTQVSLFPEEDSCCLLPFCAFIREHTKYHCIFLDDSLSAYLVEKVLARQKGTTLRQLAQNSSLPLRQLEDLLCFQFNGCFAVTKRNIRLGQDEWEQTQTCIDHFIKNGFGPYIDR